MTANFPDSSLPPLVIVDDCDDDVFLLRCRLREGGITNPIVTFGCAQEAIGYLNVMRLRGAKPGLVFVEIKMPGSEGFDLLAHLREIPEWEDVRLVVITPSNDPADLERALALRVDGYVIKFPPAELLAEFVRHGPWFTTMTHRHAVFAD
jgi:CheY-like chemotaxis protein